MRNQGCQRRASVSLTSPRATSSWQGLSRTTLRNTTSWKSSSAGLAPVQLNEGRAGADMFNHCGGHVPATVRAHETLHWRAEIVGELGGLEAAKTPPTVGHRVAGASGEEDRPLLGLEHLGPESATASEAGQAGVSRRLKCYRAKIVAPFAM